MKTIVEKVKNNIIENKLIEKDDNILIAFSGGPDSTALLHILYDLKKEMKFHLAACYINHKIRPKAVKDEIKFCWSICEKLQIDFHLINEDIPALAKETKQSIETTARDFRRAVLTQLADLDGYNKIAMAHHRDDMLETILFRLIRGTGPGGLNPIVPISEQFIRPLYNIDKSEIESYLESKKIKPMIDKSNLKDDFDRNYIRNKLIPVIEKRFGSKYKGSLSNFADIIRDENEYLSKIATNRFKKNSFITSGGKIIVDLSVISTYDDWLRKRIIKEGLKVLASHPGAGSFEDIKNIDKVVTGRTKAVSVGANINASNDKNCLILYKDKIGFKAIELKSGEITKIPEPFGKINLREVDARNIVHKKPKSQKNGLKINFDFSAISPPLYVRTVKPGDRFKPLGSKGTKKIGDYLTDKKISKYVRDEIFVVEDKIGIVWLVGYEIDDRIKIDNKTKRVGEIEYIGKKGFGRAEVRSSIFAR